MEKICLCLWVDRVKKKLREMPAVWFVKLQAAVLGIGLTCFSAY